MGRSKRPYIFSYICGGTGLKRHEDANFWTVTSPGQKSDSSVFQCILQLPDGPSMPRDRATSAFDALDRR
jgi:hypothetical protein